MFENHTEDLLLSHWGQHNVLPIRYILLSINCWGCTYSFVPLVRFTVNKHYWQVYCEKYTYMWCYIKNCYKGFTSKHFLGVITVRNVCWPMQPSPPSNPWGTDYWPDLPLWIFWRLGQTGTAQILLDVWILLCSIWVLDCLSKCGRYQLCISKISLRVSTRYVIQLWYIQLDILVIHLDSYIHGTCSTALRLRVYS